MIKIFFTSISSSSHFHFCCGVEYGYTSVSFPTISSVILTCDLLVFDFHALLFRWRIGMRVFTASQRPPIYGERGGPVNWINIIVTNKDTFVRPYFRWLATSLNKPFKRIKNEVVKSTLSNCMLHLVGALIELVNFINICKYMHCIKKRLRIYKWHIY